MNRTDALKRPFAVGVGLILLLMLGIGVAINKADANRHRPEGIAERWLDAVADTTHNGVKTDGRSRAEKIGPGVAYASLIPRASTDGKTAFEDLQVGKATGVKVATPRLNGTTGRVDLRVTDARVPFALHQRNGDAVKGTVTLHRLANGDWHVTGFGPRRPGELVPSEGAIGFALVCTRLVDWAGPAPVPSR